LAGHGTKDIALPSLDLPSRKVGQFLFFANGCCYGSDKCWRFAVGCPVRSLGEGRLTGPRCVNACRAGRPQAVIVWTRLAT
jgi:hypothetical protein